MGNAEKSVTAESCSQILKNDLYILSMLNPF